MAQAFRTKVLSGYFNCRVYRNGVAKEARQMKQDGENITFDVGFAEYPKELTADGGTEFIKETEVNGLKRWYVSFKVGKICRFFDKEGKKMDRPSNLTLDSKRWDACLQYKVLHGDASKLQCRGFWADAIQLKPANEIAFAPMDDGNVQQGVDIDEPVEPLNVDEPPF